ncbi:alpha/beta fold hydrolase [Zhihengliuella alba]|uniref:Alpha/beta fold hydrolase n=1 Tax=Zhihengliuella alba TaxID=547018 RepID=A0ABP7DBJ5_9MICC
MPTENLTFTSATGHELAAVLDVPEGPAVGWGVMSHGFTLGKDSHATARVCRELARRGVGMLRYDNLGLGGSEGDFADTSFSLKVQDTVLAAEELRRLGHEPELLVGHSLGGAAVLAAAAEIRPHAVATIGAPFHPGHVTHNFEHLMADIEAQGSAELKLGPRRLEITRAFIEDVEQHDLRGYIRDLDAALLVMHSPTDNTVGLDNAGKIFTEARHPKSFFSLDGADHLLTRRIHGARAAAMIAAWADQYFSGAEQAARAAD